MSDLEERTSPPAYCCSLRSPFPEAFASSDVATRILETSASSGLGAAKGREEGQ